jgi:rhomboid protease GluP
MDANLVFLFMAALSAGVTLWRVLFIFPTVYNRGWIVVSGIVLVVSAVGWFVFPNQVGYVVGLLWLVLALVPSLAQRLALSWDNQGRYEAAYRLSSLARVLHPAGQLRYFPDMIRSRWYLTEGKYDEAKAVLQGLSNNPVTAFYGMTMQFWLTGDYEGLMRWIDSHYSKDAFKRDPNLVIRYLSALGITGDLNRMVSEFNSYRSTLERSTSHLNYGLLYVYSACGCLPQVEQLLASAFHMFKPELKQQWIAMTQVSAGAVEQGNATLNQLLNAKDGQVRRSVQNILARPTVQADAVLTANSKALLAQITQQYQNFQRYDRSQASSQLRRQYVTIALVVVILIVYVLEIQQGGDTDTETLYRLGALWPPAVTQGGEWWRLITVMFLHFGFLHVALNLVALVVIGPSVESMLGRVRYTIVYFVAGIGSAYAAVLFTQLNWLAPDVYVGASGAIMGLFGAAAAIYFHDWRTSRSGIALNFLRRMGLIIGLQVVADLTIPGTSLPIHLIGAIIGFIVTLLLYQVMARKPRVATA